MTPMKWLTNKNNLYPLLLLIMVLVVYGSTLTHGFTNWDDDRNILSNPFIRSFSIANISYILTHSFVGMYIPLTMLTYMFNFLLGGFNPEGYIAFNVLFHALNVILVYRLMRFFFSEEHVPFIIAALFAVHPMNIEGVSWLSARSNVLFSFFYLQAIIEYIRYKRGEPLKRYAYALGLFLLACFSKSAAVSLPLLFIAIDWYEDKSINLSKQLDKIPFFLLSIIFGVLTIYFRAESRHLLNFENLYNPIEKVFFVIYSFDFYLIKMLLPFNLSPFYIYPAKEYGSLPLPYYLSPLLIIVLAYIWYKLKEQRFIIAFALLTYLITIFLVLKFVPVGNQIVADRYAYLPMLFIFFGIFKVLEHSGNQYKTKRNIAVYAVLALFSILAIIQNKIWTNSITLYETMISDNPTISLPYYNRALAWAEMKEYESAEQDFNNAIKYDTRSSYWAYMNRGNTRKYLNNYKGALDDYSFALKQSPDNAMILYNIGTLKTDMRDYLGAIDALTRYTAKEKSNSAGQNALGKAYSLNREYEKAISCFSKAILLDATNGEAVFNRGLAYFSVKDFTHAINDFNTLLKANPDDMYALYNRGLCLSAQGDETSACMDIRNSARLGYQDAQILYDAHCK